MSTLSTTLKNLQELHCKSALPCAVWFVILLVLMKIFEYRYASRCDCRDKASFVGGTVIVVHVVSQNFRHWQWTHHTQALEHTPSRNLQHDDICRPPLKWSTRSSARRLTTDYMCTCAFVSFRRGTKLYGQHVVVGSLSVLLPSGVTSRVQELSSLKPCSGHHVVRFPWAV